MELFGLSIMFVNREFGTYVFCFAGSLSIDMAKFIFLLGKEKGRWGVTQQHEIK